MSETKIVVCCSWPLWAGGKDDTDTDPQGWQCP